MKIKELGLVAALVGLGWLAAPGSAQATVINLTAGGINIAPPGPGTISSVAPTFYDFDGLFLGGNFVLNNGSFNTFVNNVGIAAPPFNDTTVYGSLGSNVNPAQVTFTPTSAASYFGFFWGSVDQYNSITIKTTDNQSYTYGGFDVLPPALGNQGLGGSVFVNFAATGGAISQVIFNNTGQPAFEFDNIAIAFAPPNQNGVPELSTWGMIIAGFAGIGLMGWRRSRNDTTSLAAA